MSEQDSAAEAAALDAEERLWLEGFGDEPEADEAEWDDALWEEGDGEVTLRAGAWDEDVAASAGSCDASEDPVGPHSEDEDTEDEESPEVDSRGRFELRYTLTHPASRERICSAGDVLSEDAIAGGLVVGGVIHDRTQRYASHYTVEYLMVGCEQPCVAQPSQPHQSVAASKTINSPSVGARMSQRALGIGADGIDEEELQVTQHIAHAASASALSRTCLTGLARRFMVSNMTLTGCSRKLSNRAAATVGQRRCCD